MHLVQVKYKQLTTNIIHGKNQARTMYNSLAILIEIMNSLMQQLRLVSMSVLLKIIYITKLITFCQSIIQQLLYGKRRIGSLTGLPPYLSTML